jgi:hypothetical protein
VSVISIPLKMIYECRNTFYETSPTLNFIKIPSTIQSSFRVPNRRSDRHYEVNRGIFVSEGSVNGTDFAGQRSRLCRVSNIHLQVTTQGKPCFKSRLLYSKFEIYIPSWG